MSGAGPACLAAAYLLGGIPFGMLLFKLSGKGDIRARGSGNIGATNVLRAGGRALGAITFVLDAGKGAAAVWLAHVCSAGEGWPEAAALAAVAGHCFPPYLRFRGGKGIATGCGAFMALAPAPTLAALAIFTVTSVLTRMVSVGSIAAALALPLLILWLEADAALLASVGASALVVIARHTDNIRRILRGEEHRVARGEGGSAGSSPEAGGGGR